MYYLLPSDLNEIPICITLSQVVIPSLHLSLGIYKKLFDLFESACNDLDLQLCQLRAQHDDTDLPSSSNFEDQIITEAKRQQEISAVLAENRVSLEKIEEDLPLCVLDKQQFSVEFRELANEAFRLRAEIMEQVRNLVIHKTTCRFCDCHFCTTLPIVFSFILIRIFPLRKMKQLPPK